MIKLYDIKYDVKLVGYLQTLGGPLVVSYPMIDGSSKIDEVHVYSYDIKSTEIITKFKVKQLK